MKNERISSFISKYKNANLQMIDQNDVHLDIRDITKSIPFPFVSLRIGEIIERMRNNNNGEIFNSIDDISCRKDYYNIKKYGRANCLNRSIFYGTISSPDLGDASATNALETNNILRSQDKTSDHRQVFTTGFWQVSDELMLLVLPFDEATLVKNKVTKETNESYINFYKATFKNSFHEIFKLLEFFSNEFSKSDINNDHDYKISATLTDIFLYDYNFDGIIYPSVRANYEAFNIALKPESLHKIKLISAGMFELIIHKDQVIIDPIAISLDLDKNDSNFSWTYVDRTSSDDIEKLLGD